MASSAAGGVSKSMAVLLLRMTFETPMLPSREARRDEHNVSTIHSFNFAASPALGSVRNSRRLSRHAERPPIDRTLTYFRRYSLAAMSDPSPAAPAEQAFIDLKVLSPSTEVDADMFFVKLPASTTVAELKLKIKDQIATKPAVERMRLIYRGRVMAKESDTMTDVFGRDEVNTVLLYVVWSFTANSLPDPRVQRAEPAPRPPRIQPLVPSS